MQAYWLAPQDTFFSGVLRFVKDQNAYFSFIRQAADGHVLFINRMTHMEHQPAFLNLQWLLAGRTMSLVNYDFQWTFSIYRALGAFSLIFGFSALASQVLKKSQNRIIALLMCAFGGGFAWFFLKVKRLPFFDSLDWSLFAFLELSSNIHPFYQILVTPHTVLPIGLLCLFFMLYLVGEKSGKIRWYCFAGLIGIIDGLMRPYDMISIITIIPVFIAIEMILKREFSYRQIFMRIIPLIMVVPIGLYYYYLFYFHPIFKFWGQGTVPFTLPFYWHIINLGLAGVLCIVRIGMFRKYPMDSASRLIFTWIASTLFLVHAYKFMNIVPYSYQIQVTLLPPIILLGVSLLDHVEWPWRRVRFGLVLLIILFAVNSLSSAVLMKRNLISVEVSSKAKSILIPGPEEEYQLYIPASELAAYLWLDENSKEDDIVLSTISTGGYIARYASVRVALGHLQDVTPMAKEISPRVNRFFSGEMTLDESRTLIDDLGADWIFFGHIEKTLYEGQIEMVQHLKSCYDNEDVTIYAAPHNSCN